MRIMSVFGTRPEAIKMAPVLRAMRSDPRFESCICVTGQHRHMLDQAMAIFDLEADHDLDVMRANQDLFDVTTRTLERLRAVIADVQPELILVQGDTTSCLAGGLAGFYSGIAIGHVEAGLRTFNLRAPFPEEGNRQLVSRLTDLHFAPTEGSKANLLAEGIGAERVHVTGNTVIDALHIAVDLAARLDDAALQPTIGQTVLQALAAHPARTVLITGHRRENFGASFEELCRALRDLAVAHPDWLFIYPVHLNPNVRAPVFAILEGLANVHLIEPLDYLPFVWLMNRADFIVTDSGGIQEEAPSLGKPVIVMRDVTERPEAVDAGTVELVGTDYGRIVGATEAILGDDERYRRMSEAHNPYGDGKATGRILDALDAWKKAKAAA